MYHTTVKDNADREDTYIEMLEYMLQSCDFDVNIPNNLNGTEETALDIALHQKNARVVLMLLSDARTKLTHRNLTPLRTMAINNKELVSLLQKRGIQNETGIGQAIHNTTIRVLFTWTP